MKSFQDILQSRGYEFLDNLMNDYVLVYEKLNASTLSFKRIGEEIHFYKGVDKEEITQTNLALYSYFQKGIDYIKNVSLIFYREFPENWLFKFQYFVDNKTNVIEYDYIPQNNLILTCIDSGTNIIEDPDILKKWADRLQVDYSKPLFQGFLSEFQKEKINDFVQGKYQDNVPFSQYLTTLLNPSLTHSAYKDGFDGGVDSFIFKFYSPNNKKCVCAKIMDPYMLSIINNGDNSFDKDKHNNETEIILTNFIAFLQTIKLDEIKVEGNNDDERYLDLICKLFNLYIDKEKKLFSGIKTEKVDENYGVNFDNIKNEETKKLLKDNPNLVTTFQIIVGNFTEYKNPNDVNPLSLLNTDLINMFNNEVDKIKEISKEKTTTKTFMDLMTKDDKKEETNKEDKVLSYTEFLKREGLEKKDEPTQKEESETKKEKEEPKKVEHNEEKKEEPKKKDNVKENDSEEPKKEKGSKEAPKEDNQEKEDNDKKEETSENEKTKDGENKEEEEPKNDEDKETDIENDEQIEDKSEGDNENDKQAKNEKPEEKPSEEPKGEQNEPKEEQIKEEPVKEEPVKKEPTNKPEKEPKEKPKKEKPEKVEAPKPDKDGNVAL